MFDNFDDWKDALDELLSSTDGLTDHSLDIVRQLDLKAAYNNDESPEDIINHLLCEQAL